MPILYKILGVEVPKRAISEVVPIFKVCWIQLQTSTPSKDEAIIRAFYLLGKLLEKLTY